MIWIIALVILLYIRTLNYNYVVDDYVERDGYLYDIPMEGPGHSFWSRKPSPWYRLFMIGMHCVNVSIIYMLWGWAPALLFAVHPVAVWGTAWVTGNYYATTTYFCLIAYYILHTFPNVWGAIVAMSIYAVALNSTICAIGFPFLFFSPWGLTMFFPLIMFLTGKRFKTGIAIRTRFNATSKVNTKFTLKRLVLMTKLVARYIYTIFVPDKLGLFSSYGNRIQDHQDRYDKMHKIDGEFWSSLFLCLTVFGVGLVINPAATIWFFVFIGVHSQFKIMGQFYAQRYLYLPMVGLCVIAGTVLQHYPLALTAVVTFLIVRTHLFIPAWRNQETMLRHDMEMYPENPHTWNNGVNYLLGEKDGVFKNPYCMHEAALWMIRALSLAPDDYEVHMNAAAYYNAIGQIGLVLHHTERAMECLKAISDETHPTYIKLVDQRNRTKERINKLTNEGRLGAGNSSLSRPQDNPKDYLKKEEEHGTVKEESRKDFEHNGSPEYQRGEERVAECATGS